MLFDVLDTACDSVARELGTTTKEALCGVYLEDSRNSARKLLERVFNQNEQSVGLFYLHPDEGAGIAVQSVALLRIGISLRVQHYGTLQRSRCGRLAGDFRAKLGWLVGNLFSRVATHDWDRSDVKKMSNRFLKGAAAGDQPIWCKKPDIQALRAAVAPVAILTRDNIVPELEKCKPLPPTESAVKVVSEVIAKVVPVSASPAPARIVPAG